MSDDDERMDRARRIREMREGGGRDPDEESADAGTEDTDSDAGTEDEGAESDAGTADESAESDADEWGETLTEEETTPHGETENEPETAESEEEPAAEETTEDETDEPETDESETDETAGDTTVPEGDESGISAPLPGAEQLEEALEESEEEAEAETVAPGIEDEEEEETQEETRVLEFTLDDEHYCLDIEYIEEIVKQETITRVPNTPDFVEGVVDLRGQITTILNPKVTIGKDDEKAGELIIVFDADSFDDQGYIGWVVDDVRQVSPITDADVNDPPVEDEHINGVIDREDQDEFVIWTTPQLTLDEAE